MPERVESGDYFLDQEIEEARDKGYELESFRAGWKIGYGTGRTLHSSRETPLQGIEAGEVPVIAQRGEPMVTPGSRAVPLEAVLSTVQAPGVKDWRPERVVLYAAVLVVSALALMAGLSGVFGPELLANGLARVWDWWIQPG
jgi:hypothetical protein